ncbi:flavohemoglobin expression-modulating QEGLA motif protein [Ornithinimicrobium panacihumi]|uniref:flavohemoglobin expression-modulating QEGLA motif protein n=1 Tax=Ornithinimicrobium panacihumi TaxID=2008449 RepID=UPI003F88F6DE
MTTEAPVAGVPQSDTGPTATLAVEDLAVDHTLAMLAGGIRFLLDVTPVDADDHRADFLAGTIEEPAFTYRELDVDPDVFGAQLDQVPLDRVQDATLADLLRNKHREMKLQLEMLRARDTDDFRQLSVELYGAVGPTLRGQAEDLVARLDVAGQPGDMLTADEFLALAEAEIEAYREEDPDAGLHAEVRPDVSGVLVEGNVLLISESSSIAAVRGNALIQHEVGTHLVTQVNGSGQPIKTLGGGLAGYDETQEGLAVLAEVGCGGLTPFRLRQLAARVLTVHRMLTGATFREAHEALVGDGVPAGTAYSTVMRVYRAGGLTKDAIYLRGLLDLREHLAREGRLDLLFLGKFALRDLPLVQDLHDRGLLRPPRLTPRWLRDPRAVTRLREVAGTDDLTTLTKGLE